MAYTFKDLKIALGRRRGFDGNPNRLGQFINDACTFIASRKTDWDWLRTSVQFQTRPKLTGTTSSVTGFSNGSHLVNGLTNPVCLVDGVIASPDGAAYRIRRGDPAGGVYLPVPYPGADALEVAWRIYFDQYPLPPDLQRIEVITAEGNGWSTRIKQNSTLPQSMARLSIDNFESRPQYFSLVEHQQLPNPRRSPTTAVGSSTGLTGTYYYWVAFLNDATGQVGPLSSVSSAVTVSNEKVDLSDIPTHGDYRRRLFRSEAGETEPYFLIDLNATATTYTDNKADDDLGLDTSTGQEYGRHHDSASQPVLRVWPPPDAEYLVTVRYYRTHPTLVFDHDVPLVPGRHRTVLLDFAESLALSEEESHGAAGQKRNQALEGIENMVLQSDEDPTTRVGLGRGTALPDLHYLNDGHWPDLVGQS